MKMVVKSEHSRLRSGSSPETSWPGLTIMHSVCVAGLTQDSVETTWLGFHATFRRSLPHFPARKEPGPGAYRDYRQKKWQYSIGLGGAVKAMPTASGMPFSLNERRTAPRASRSSGSIFFDSGSSNRRRE